MDRQRPIDLESIVDAAATARISPHTVLRWCAKVRSVPGDSGAVTEFLCLNCYNP